MIPHFPARAPIDSYGKDGFRFAHLSHRGSLLVLPSGMYSWPVDNLDTLTREHLELLVAEKPDFDWLLMGTGADMRRPPKLILDYLASKSIPVDYMATPAALRTYNVVLGEGRRIAAAFIAPGALA